MQFEVGKKHSIYNVILIIESQHYYFENGD
jgi:hypothetical protein